MGAVLVKIYGNTGYCVQMLNLNIKSRISFYVATRQSHSDATIKQNPQKPKFMVSFLIGTGKMIHLAARGFFASKKSWGNRLREI